MVLCGRRLRQRLSPASERSGGAPARPMNDPNNVEESVRRVRRGCTFVAALFVAFAVLYTSATGNLAFLLLLIVAAAIFIFARTVR